VTEKEVSDILLFVSALYGERFKMNIFTKHAWHLCVCHVESFEVAKGAVIRHAQTSQFPPTPAELLKHVAEIADPSSQM